MKTRRNYKDTLFRMLFNDQESLLGLYNAVNGTNYENAENLEISTLENAIYMNMTEQPEQGGGDSGEHI